MITDLHDQFAMAAMQGLVSRWGIRCDESDVSAKAYQIANAMVAERERGGSESLHGIKAQLIQAIYERWQLDVSKLPFGCTQLISILAKGRIGQ